MEPKHLVHLATVIDTGSVNAAAQELGVTQPTLSRNMQTLEMQAGGQLFSRSRHGVTPTPLGEALAREGRAVTKSVWLARQASIRHELGMVREWRIGTGPLLSNVLMHRVVERLQAEYPELSLLIRVDTPYRLIEQIQNHELDVVIAPQVVATSVGISREFLAPDRLSVYAGRTHPLAGVDRPIRVADLQDQQWINLGTYARFNESPAERLQRQGVKNLITPVALAGDAITCMHILREGRYLCLMPRRLMHWVKDAYDLVDLGPDTDMGERDLYLWYPADNPVKPAVRTVRNIITDLLSVNSGAPEPEP